MTDETTTESRKELSFADEPGSSRSKWVAGLLTVALAAWMGSGYIFPAPEAEEQAEAPSREVEAIAVTVRDSEAEPVTRVFSAEGQAEPDRRAVVRAEIGGTVEELAAQKGEMLEKDQLVARLSTRELEAQLEQAKEEKARAQREYDNAQTLLERGVATTDRVTAARATLASADAGVTQAEEALGNAEIRAPFAGRLDALEIDEGEVVSAGGEVGTVLDSDPLTVVVQVPQQTLSRIQTGQTAQVTFITGEQREGEVTFVGADADSETRTFRVEVSVPNADAELASGLSAQVRIPTGEVRAHFISPAILSLGTDGELGVKTVDGDSTVAFHPVNVERAEIDGIYVSGLPDQVTMITVGQGFVREGEAVDPSPESAEGDEAVSEAPEQPVPDQPETEDLAEAD